MSKPIKITNEYIIEIREAFEKMLSESKFPDGKISFIKTIGSLNEKATIIFSEKAWNKMQTLIKEFSKEVAWHGIAKRGEDPLKNEYFITDILVYPQEVTGATVTTDQSKYEMWLMNHDDDVFNNIRMQGHSHVYMSTSPSSVDTSLYDRILYQLDDDMFYIFMIWNKRDEKTIKIYDLAKNILFETPDITVSVDKKTYTKDEIGELSDEEKEIAIKAIMSHRNKKDSESFIKDAKEKVKDQSYKSSTVGFGSGGYSGYNTKGSDTTKNNNKSDKAEDKSPAPKIEVLPKSTESKPQKRKKGKRKKNKNIDNDTTSYPSMFDDYDIRDPFYANGWY